MNRPITLAALALTLCALSSCAGPHSPFGAIEDHPKKDELLRVPAATTAELPPELSINFGPENLIYHKNFELTINVSDQEGIKELGQIAVTYNGREVQKGEWTLSNDHKEAQLKIPDLKFPSHLKHNLSVQYTKDSKVYTKKLHPPQCQMLSEERLKSLGQFAEDEHMIRMVELIAKKHGLSPSFIVALVAQQSGFDPEYVGSEQRLGLMQIKTSDSFILSNQKNQRTWPSYPEIDQESRLGLYTKIMLGLINRNNEWRLDPEKALKGGLQYLKKLETFWSEHPAKERKDLVLASYYTGPYKVLKVYNSMGNNWKKSREMASVIPKIKEVQSHCFELSNASL